MLLVRRFFCGTTKCRWPVMRAPGWPPRWVTGEVADLGHDLAEQRRAGLAKEAVRRFYRATSAEELLTNSCRMPIVLDESKTCRHKR